MTDPPDLQDLPFRLLDLPAELRNRIYHCAVVSPAPIAVGWVNTQTKAQWCAMPPMPALASPCRQLRNEVTPLYYEKNTYEAPHASLLIRSVKSKQGANGDFLDDGWKVRVYHYIYRWLTEDGKVTGLSSAHQSINHTFHINFTVSCIVGKVSVVIRPKALHSHARDKDGCSCSAKIYLCAAHELALTYSTTGVADGAACCNKLKSFLRDYVRLVPPSLSTEIITVESVSAREDTITCSGCGGFELLRPRR